MKDKIKIIFIPTVLTLVGLIMVYTFLNWILFIKLELFGLKEIFTNFAIPIILTGLAAWIPLRQKLKILDLEVTRGNWRDFYSFILWVALTVPLIIAQEYITTASGQLTELNSIDEIGKSEQTKFYTVKTFYVDKKRVGVHPAFEVSGKHNEHFNMRIYLAIPILEKETDTTKWECSAWLGIEYHEKISNRLESSQKEKRYKLFAAQTQKDFERKDVSKFVYLNRIGNSDKKEGWIEAVEKNEFVNGDHTILEPINEPFESRNGKKLEWIFGSSFIGLSVWMLMLLIPKMDEAHLSRIKEGKPDKEAQEDMRDFIEFLKPKKGFLITPILIYLNLGIFILMTVSGFGFISFKGFDLLNLGANYGPLVREGEWWRLLTSMFLHGGFMHVLTNLAGLLFVGIFLEPILDWTKFLITYLITGIIASLASIWWYDATVSVGASGAIFGLYGLFIVFMLTKVFPVEFGKAFLLSAFVFVGYNLLLGLVGGIDNAAHIGGLLSGFLVGLILYPAAKKFANEKGINK